jgi:N-acetylneuraminic acid mutarotase
MKFIENEGALFRGLSRSWPKEIFSFKDKCWKPYEGEIPKGQAWGSEISALEAAELIAEGIQRYSAG